YGMDMVVPVDDRGRHTDYAGKYAGMTTDESNPAILADMKASGVLFASEDIVHSYPHCWRCKGPIIFRATPQWFCSVEAFKDDACAAADDVRWVPDWGIERMKSMIRERADWCISRQRKWGLPIPVVYCPDCGKPICTEESIEAISALFAAEGSNAWFEKDPADFLPAGFACPACGSKGPFTKEEDTLDGWFDSGSSHFASMQRDQGFWPADMYLEGLDQYRGWFQSSLLTAVGALGKGAPFRQCVTHGWTVDEQGKAMHKSLGNGVDPADIFKRYGADMLRLWAASADYHADVRCGENIFKQLSQNYLKFRNTCKFMLDNLVDFDPKTQLVSPADMPELDRWLITRLNELMEKAEQSYNDYEFHIITHAVNDFCVGVLSTFYLDIVKDRLYCDGADSVSRRSAQTALYLTLDTLTKLFAPILAFTCDEVWLAMPHRDGDDPRNVLLNDMNKPFTDYALSGDLVRWAELQMLRDGVNGALEKARADKKIGKSLEAHVTLVKSDDSQVELEKTLDAFGAQLADLFIVSDVEVSHDAALYDQGEDTQFAGWRVAVSEAKGEKCPRCWKHTTGANADGLCKRCAEVVSKLPDLA
ncbi:MAG: isoleucine--tRNA ligase, partial [Ruminococcaceae bacterium]|nr:isoleucine--tRNA ligase [Oscillospiraceae bacterium]